MGSGATNPRRGEIWEVNLDPSIGREQGGSHPLLVISDDALNSGPRGVVIVLPITGTNRGFPTHVPVDPPEGGLSQPSVIMVEAQDILAADVQEIRKRISRMELAGLGSQDASGQCRRPSAPSEQIERPMADEANFEDLLPQKARPAAAPV